MHYLLCFTLNRIRLYLIVFPRVHLYNLLPQFSVEMSYTFCDIMLDLFLFFFCSIVALSFSFSLVDGIPYFVIVWLSSIFLRNSDGLSLLQTLYDLFGSFSFSGCFSVALFTYFILAKHLYFVQGNLPD